MSRQRARKRFGQHFLTDAGVISAIVSAIAARGEDTIVEIGPGPGAITHPVVQRAGRFHAIELDRDLAAKLAERYRGNARVTVHQADALSFDFSSLGSSLRLIGNLPYNVSTPLLFHLLDHLGAIADMHFMLQKEVVDRMAAGPGSKAYGRLGIMLGCYLDIEPLFDVDPAAFQPQPKVRSTVVRLCPLPAGAVHLVDRQALSSLLAAAFGQRRKTLRNALQGVVEPAALEAAGIDPALRAEAVPVADWVTLANRLAAGRDSADNGSASR